MVKPIQMFMVMTIHWMQDTPRIDLANQRDWTSESSTCNHTDGTTKYIEKGQCQKFVAG